MRTGIGYDIHRFESGRRLVLGGVDIPYVKGLISYTDGDVVLHAIADAILGALSLGDIGKHFPNTDPSVKGISSLDIIRKVREMAAEKKRRVTHVDVVIVAEEPKIQPFKEQMVASIADALMMDKGSVNVKATTNEGVGSLGRGEAIASYAVATLEKFD